MSNCYYLTPKSKMVASLSTRQPLFKHIIHPFFLRPLQMPAGNFYLSPFAILKGLQNTIVKAGFKGYL